MNEIPFGGLLTSAGPPEPGQLEQVQEPLLASQGQRGLLVLEPERVPVWRQGPELEWSSRQAQERQAQERQPGLERQEPEQRQPGQE